MIRQREHSIGVDLGGTRMRAALIGPRGKVAAMHAVEHAFRSADEFIKETTAIVNTLIDPAACPQDSDPTPSPDSLLKKADSLAWHRHFAAANTGVKPVPHILQQAAKHSTSFLGLAVAGLLDGARSMVRRSVNLACLEGVPIAEQLAKATGLPVRLCTDIEAATWAEFTAYASESDPSSPATTRSTRFAHLRIGTGAGLGMVADSVLIPLEPDRSTHLSTLIVDHSDGARPCRCGLRGCLETLVSGPVLIEEARRAGINGGLAEVNEQAMGGITTAQAIVDAAAGALAATLGNLLKTLQVQVVCLGGGVIEHLPVLFDRVQALLAGSMHGLQGPRLVRAALGDQAGCIGAALLSAAPMPL